VGDIGGWGGVEVAGGREELAKLMGTHVLKTEKVAGGGGGC
jgi:hypothetical protein